MKQKKSIIFYYIGIFAPYWMAILFFILYKIGIYTVISNFMDKLEESTKNFFISFWNGPYKEPVLIGAAFGLIIFIFTIIESDLNDEKDEN